MPAGIYAKEALTSLGLWTAVEPRLAPSENVRVALAHVERGETPLGIVYATDAKIDRNVKVLGTFPPGSYKPITYPFAIVEGKASAGRESISSPISPGRTPCRLREIRFHEELKPRENRKLPFVRRMPLSLRQLDLRHLRSERSLALLDVYFWPTGNGKKITIMCEECGLDYRIVPINIGKGDQFTPEFLQAQPERQNAGHRRSRFSGRSASRFSSPARSWNISRKRPASFCPRIRAAAYEVIQWVYWQVGGLGPMAGQAHHFLRYAPQKVEYAMNRFRNETARLYGVLDKQLSDPANSSPAIIRSPISRPGRGSRDMNGRSKISTTSRT